MSLPFGHPDTTFESFLQELPRTIGLRSSSSLYPVAQDQDAGQLLQVVMSYCGWTRVAGSGGQFTCSRNASAIRIHKRLKACVPWVKRCWSTDGEAAQPLLGTLRFVIVDGSTVQGPGATAPVWLHLPRSGPLEWAYSLVTTSIRRTVEHYPLQEAMWCSPSGL